MMHLHHVLYERLHRLLSVALRTSNFTPISCFIDERDLEIASWPPFASVGSKYCESPAGVYGHMIFGCACRMLALTSEAGAATVFSCTMPARHAAGDNTRIL